jgi:predicted secreted protein
MKGVNILIELQKEFHNFCADKCPLNKNNKCQIIDFPCPAIEYLKYLSKVTKEERGN